LRLPDADRELFYRLLWRLLFYAGEQLEFLPHLASPEALSQLDEETWRRLRDRLYEHPDLFDSFASANPFRFTKDELDIVRSWRGFLRGKFFVWRYLRKYTVFLTGEGEALAYGVVAPNKPFELMLGPHLPVAIEAVLLPFKDKIVYDGLFASYPVRFGPGIKKMLNETYRDAKARHGIITSLGLRRTDTKPGPTGSPSENEALKFRYWRGLAKRLSYRLEELKLVTDSDVPPNELTALIKKLRRERLFDLPAKMGLREGFDPIEVDVLELESGGNKKRIEVFNRAASLFYMKDPEDIRRFHRFACAIVDLLPGDRQGIV